MVLPHLLQSSPKYRDFYTDVEGYKILDNGAAEGIRTGIHDLLTWADIIEADEIVLPDVIGDYAATVAVFKSLPEYVWNRGNNYMAVVQGESISDLKRCIDLYGQIDCIKTIAFPRALNRNNPYGRREAIEALMMDGTLNDWEVHCLGASIPIDECKELAALGVVRGIDTSLPVVMGLADASLADGDAYVPRQDYFFDPDFGISIGIEEVIDDNLRTYVEWCRDPKEAS